MPGKSAVCACGEQGVATVTVHTSGRVVVEAVVVEVPAGPPEPPLAEVPQGRWDTWEPLGAAWLFRALEKSLRGVGLPGKAGTVAPCGCAPSRLHFSSLCAALGSPVHTRSPASHENGAGEAGLGAPRRPLSGPGTGTRCWTPSTAGGTAGSWEC